LIAVSAREIGEQAYAADNYGGEWSANHRGEDAHKRCDGDLDRRRKANAFAFCGKSDYRQDCYRHGMVKPPSRSNQPCAHPGGAYNQQTNPPQQEGLATLDSSKICQGLY
jgi:hypothetical protein